MIKLFVPILLQWMFVADLFNSICLTQLLKPGTTHNDPQRPTSRICPFRLFLWLSRPFFGLQLHFKANFDLWKLWFEKSDVTSGDLKSQSKMEHYRALSNQRAIYAQVILFCKKITSQLDYFGQQFRVTLGPTAEIHSSRGSNSRNDEKIPRKIK